MFNSANLFNESFFNQFRQLQSELESAFGSFPEIADIRQAARQGFPPTVVSDKDNEVSVKLYAAGFNADDFDITLEKNLLKIQAARGDAAESSAEEGENVRYHLRERRADKVNRVVTLPDDCDMENVNAEYKNGVLTVTVARKEKARPRVISVQ
ncbi:Hsp20/alpha crystallin family protein [Granulosicoccaceae sp. 1_MG-2023]|nr:Hsp20/alpha crystallin family protein [Granulosicoccaceae sp. 1_MG-2023]